MFAGRGTQRYARPGHIPSSTNVPFVDLVNLQSHAYLDPETPRQQFEAAGALGKKRVITYCGAGLAASSVTLALSLLGVENVGLYNGSLYEWTADPALPMETGD